MLRLLTAAVAAAILAAPGLAQTPAQAPAQAPAKAPAGAYVLDKPHSSITWKGLHQGLSWYTARFNSYDITLEFDQDDVSKSKVTASINPKSVETDDAKKRASGQSAFNEEVGDRILQGAKFPEIKFVSTSISKTGDTAGKMTGDVTFLGVTKPVTLDVVMIGGRADARTQKYKVGFSATGTIKRSEFGMSGPGSMADEVKIEINAEFAQK